jgi:hypothetical protein
MHVDLMQWYSCRVSVSPSTCSVTCAIDACKKLLYSSDKIQSRSNDFNRWQIEARRAAAASLLQKPMIESQYDYDDSDEMYEICKY